MVAVQLSEEVPDPKSGVDPLEERLRHIRLHDPELTTGQLAERLAISRDKVRYLLQKMNLAPAPAHEGIYSGSVASFRERKRRAGKRRSAARGLR